MKKPPRLSLGICEHSKDDLMANCAIDISIVVPVYNSSETIPVLVSRVRKAMLSAKLNYELILTNDCSTDHSWATIKEICTSDGHVVGLALANNCGQWPATLAGMSKASGQYIVTMDDDMEYDPRDIGVLYNAIKGSDHAVVFGLSKDKYRTQGKYEMLSVLRNGTLNLLWHKQVTDSFRILKRGLIFNDSSFLPHEPIDVFISRHTDSIGYCEVKFYPRFQGSSNYTLRKKIKLFFLYSSCFSHDLMRKAQVTGFLFLGNMIVLVYLIISCGHRWQLISGLVLTLFVFVVALAYYSMSILAKPSKPLYSISSSLSNKPV
jgi:glycosyltransferase involved in cell wall biosynthesis